uniref:Uncharacterized protein AlNc14C62G4521 n=1 Tax=Albugo laibachii Nc14 TaxID=890382 RepID=F0WCZ7_9STRA|nr:hypothetical protein PITG_20284 [Albugo laibachii Nc14]|eukprot:CCA19068.1 hypothetical protein PITG_20284 [Albugo laibachii Nc14]
MSMEKALKKKKQLAWLNRLKGALKAEEACKETDDESSGDEKFVSKCVKKRSKEKKKTKISSLESKSLESKTCFPTLEKTPATLNKIKNIKKSSGISRTKSLNEKPKKRSIPQESLAGEPTKSVVPIKRKRKLQQGAETQVSKERKTVKKVVEREKSLEHVIERPHVERNGKPDHAVSTITPKAKANSSDKIFRAPEVIPKRPTQGATLIDKKSKLEGENKPTQMRPISNETVTATSIDSVKPQEKDEKLSFMIPKKCIQSATDKEFRLTQSHTNGDRSGSNDQGQHSAVLSDCIAQPNTTSFLGKSCLGEEDMQFLTLAKVHNSFWSACHEKERLLPSTKYAVVNEDGQVSPEPCERQMHCAPILTMKGSKDKYPPNFFGIVPTQKKSTAESSEKASPTQVEGPSPLDPPEPEPTELGATYQKLNFRNRGDRQWYQKSMYGICFTPLFLRQPSTLLARRMKFVRKSTGFRFNTKRDKEELIQAIQQRYKVNESIPRVDIPPRNWQLMMKSEVSTVYLQYRNREDALIASQTMHDDTGQLLLFKDSNVYQQDSRIRTPDAQMNVKRGDAHPNFAYPNHNRRSRSRSSSRASAPRHRSRSRDVQDVQHRPGRVNGKDASPNVTSAGLFIPLPEAKLGIGIRVYEKSKDECLEAHWGGEMIETSVVQEDEWKEHYLVLGQDRVPDLTEEMTAQERCLEDIRVRPYLKTIEIPFFAKKTRISNKMACTHFDNLNTIVKILGTPVPTLLIIDRLFHRTKSHLVNDPWDTITETNRQRFFMFGIRV